MDIRDKWDFKHSIEASEKIENLKERLKYLNEGLHEVNNAIAMISGMMPKTFSGLYGRELTAMAGIYSESIRHTKEMIEGQKRTEKDTYKGLVSTLSDEQIKVLKDKMQGKYFKPGEPFETIFSQDPHPVKWDASFRLLAYFIGKCPQITDKSKWIKASQIFETKNNLQQSLGSNPYPKGHEDIEEIINSIKV